MSQRHILLFYTLTLVVCYFTLHSVTARAAAPDTAPRVNLTPPNETPDLVVSNGQTTVSTALAASGTAGNKGSPTLPGTATCCTQNMQGNAANNGTPVRPLGNIELAGAGNAPATTTRKNGVKR
jgi:hypothetical protein